MPVFTHTDQMGRRVTLPSYPQRIVSLVPSQTELLYDLGLGDRVVGITKFCIHPHQWFKAKTRVGGTKNVKLDVVKSLNPDLIIGNKEENSRADIEALMPYNPVWMSDIATLTDALGMIKSIGEITNTESKAVEIIAEIQTGFGTIIPIEEKPTVLYLIWKPYMAAGSHTFISEMLNIIGFENIIKNERYPSLSPEEISLLSPDFIFLSSEPFPFKDQHIAELQALSPYSKIQLVDGEMFSWYGSRLKYAPSYFNQLITDM